MGMSMPDLPRCAADECRLRRCLMPNSAAGGVADPARYFNAAAAPRRRGRRNLARVRFTPCGLHKANLASAALLPGQLLDGAHCARVQCCRTRCWPRRTAAHSTTFTESDARDIEAARREFRHAVAARPPGRRALCRANREAATLRGVEELVRADLARAFLRRATPSRRSTLCDIWLTEAS